MSSDPILLYSINNISAYYLQNGEENELNPSGPQTLSLLMVPTTTTTEDDFYLHLHLPPELDMPLPATTQIYPQGPNSYLIPRWDLASETGAFIRIKFPDIGSGPDQVAQEDVDTFESILAQCTAFMEHATVPQEGDGKGHAKYNPADYESAGEGSNDNNNNNNGKIVLVDEENGSVMGELTEGYDIVEKPGVKPGSKNPVEIQLPSEGEGNQISINTVSEEYLGLARHPAYKDSTVVQKSAEASRVVVTGSSYLSNLLRSGAENFTKKTKPNPKPMSFSETTQSRIRKVSNISHGAANLTARTTGQVSKYAQNFGASLAARGKDTDNHKGKGVDKDGNPNVYEKPGIMNRSLIAFSTLSDGLEQSARNVLESSGAAATTMVGHRYGQEASTVARDFTSGFKNAGLVYIDATGVSRKAFLKSVAKGMIVGQMRDGKQVVVGSGDGGDGLLSSESKPQSQSQSRQLPSPPALPSRTPPPAYGAPPGTVSLDGSSTAKETEGKE